MNEWNVGDKAVLTDKGQTANVTISQIDNLPPGQIAVTIDESGAFGVVETSQLSHV